MESEGPGARDHQPAGSEGLDGSRGAPGERPHQVLEGKAPVAVEPPAEEMEIGRSPSGAHGAMARAHPVAHPHHEAMGTVVGFRSTTWEIHGGPGGGQVAGEPHGGGLVARCDRATGARVDDRRKAMGRHGPDRARNGFRREGLVGAASDRQERRGRGGVDGREVWGRCVEAMDGGERRGSRAAVGPCEGPDGPWAGQQEPGCGAEPALEVVLTVQEGTGRDGALGAARTTDAHPRAVAAETVVGMLAAVAAPRGGEQEFVDCGGHGGAVGGHEVV